MHSDKIITLQAARLDEWKYALNIDLEHDYKHYAEIAFKKLTEDKQCPGVTLNACGNAIITLMKVSSALSEYLPGLHTVTNIKLKLCRTCERKNPKG